MFYACADHPDAFVYKLMTATITPRPIAWVTTRSADGVVNAAPYSFFNMMGHEPPTVALGLLLLLSAIIIAVRNPDPEKVSAYECGFNAFDDARMKFDVRFYLVSILFIIFDLEIAFLFPWAVAFKDVSMVGFWSMMVFLAVLTIGFAYEWKKGALEWE